MIKEQESRDVSLLAEDQYRREAGQVSPDGQYLSYEEEALLFGKIACSKREPENRWRARIAQAARDQLVESYQWLVMSLARRYAGSFRGQMEWLDLVQEGNIGLLRAIDQHKGEKGGFNGLARCCIVQALWAARGKGGHLALSQEIRYRLSRVVRARQRISSQLGREVTAQDIALDLGLSLEEVNQALICLGHERVESLQAVLELDGEETGEDRLELSSVFAPFSDAEESSVGDFAPLHKAMATFLSDRQREVLNLRYGLVEDDVRLTPKEITERFGGSCASSAYQFHKKALGALREVLEVRQDGASLSCSIKPCYDDFYTTSEVAKLLGVSAESARCLAKDGKLPATRGRKLGGPKSQVTWLFSKQAVEDFIVLRQVVSA